LVGKKRSSKKIAHSTCPHLGQKQDSAQPKCNGLVAKNNVAENGWPKTVARKVAKEIENEVPSGVDRALPPPLSWG